MILAIMFYDGDINNSMGLARLLADVETRYRNDVTLILVYQPGTIITTDVVETVVYCNSKFNTILTRSPLGGAGWFDGSGQLWSGSLSVSVDNKDHSSVFLIDGGDSVPLCNDWIVKLQAAHSETLKNNKRVTGFLVKLGDVPYYIHANMVLDLSFVRENTSLLKFKTLADGGRDMLEIFHFPVLYPSLLPTSRIWSAPNSRGCTPEILRKLSDAGICWLHGYKDDNLVDKARELLLGSSSRNQWSMAMARDILLGHG